jgi:hypothetical protein
MTLLGFDFNAGRLDVSAHPFCGGVPEDVRITTRYDENELLSALLAWFTKPGTPVMNKTCRVSGWGNRSRWRVLPPSMNRKACF